MSGTSRSTDARLSPLLEQLMIALAGDDWSAVSRAERAIAATYGRVFTTRGDVHRAASLASLLFSARILAEPGHREAMTAALTRIEDVLEGCLTRAFTEEGRI